MAGKRIISSHCIVKRRFCRCVRYLCFFVIFFTTTGYSSNYQPAPLTAPCNFLLPSIIPLAPCGVGGRVVPLYRRVRCEFRDCFRPRRVLISSVHPPEYYPRAALSRGRFQLSKEVLTLPEPQSTHRPFKVLSFKLIQSDYPLLAQTGQLVSRQIFYSS